METTIGHESPTLGDYIGGRFKSTNFFQCVRMIESLDFYIWPMGSEVVNFSVQESYAFPKSSISNVTWAPKGGLTNRPRIEITFMGLNGVAGVLPTFYTSMTIKQNQLNNFVLSNFFETFNHRHISLYYRAWEKNHFIVDFERKRRKKQRDDLFTEMLDAIAGFGHALVPVGVARTLGVQDRDFLNLGDLGLNRPVRFVARKSF